MPREQRHVSHPLGIPRSLLLSLWLSPTLLLTPQNTSPAPSLNLMFDPRTMRLSWACQEGATNVTCRMIHGDRPIEERPKDEECWCSFKSTPLHGGLTLQVHANLGHRALQEKLVYTNPGEAGTAASNFSCFIYNAASMNCSWEKGPSAPEDAEYFLYIVEDVNRQTQMECPHYTSKSGTHTGCHFPDLSGFQTRNYFMVNGTSPGTDIQFFDAILTTREIERISPPDQVHVHCNGNSCKVYWTQPKTLADREWDSYSKFMYQIDIQKQPSVEPGSRNPLINRKGTSTNKYSFQHPEPKEPHVVRVRAAHVTTMVWSTWSQPVEFGLPPYTGPRPVLNLTFDVDSMRLSWACQEGVTNVRCHVEDQKGASVMRAQKGECGCQLSYTTLHGGLTLQVFANYNHTEIQERLVYTNPGEPGTAAQNLSCLIYDAGSMNCTWQKGPAAPYDVQYFLYLKEDYERQEEMECPRYTPDTGTHTGCHIPDLLGFRFPLYYFLLNGTSRGTKVQFFDTTLSAIDIERLNPPNNVTVRCDPTQCQIQWEKPHAFIRQDNFEFEYQLDIQTQENMETGSESPLIKVGGKMVNIFNFTSPAPRAKHRVRLRAKDFLRDQWSAWSQPVEFGSADQKVSALHVYLLAVLGTVCTLVVGFVFIRFLRKLDLCTQVPQVKDKLNSVYDIATQMSGESHAVGTGEGITEDLLAVHDVS